MSSSAASQLLGTSAGWELFAWGRGNLMYLNIAWSPDGRWFFVASRGRLLVFDTETYRSRRLDLELPPVSYLAIRTDRP